MDAIFSDNMEKFLTNPIFRLVGQLADEHHVELYTIGGFVRDCLLDRPFKNDIDLLVIGNGTDFAEKVGSALQSKVTVFQNFGTAMLRYKDTDLEFVGARKESYRRQSRKPIVESGSLQDDQKRRDFTINAMALGLNKENYGVLIDPFNGLHDLEERVIRTPLDPEVTFSDDPLRMMRAIRFASQLLFDIHPETFQAIKANKERINIVSKERITDELQKIVASEKPSVGFNLLFESGLLKLIFRAMYNLQGVEIINGKSHKDNFFHTLEVLDNVAKSSDDIWLRWAAIMHDIAKPATKKFDSDQGWTFHGHEDKGARMVPKLFAELRLPLNEKMKFVQKMVCLHLRPIVLAKDIVTDSAVRRLLFEAGDDIDALMKLCHADVTTKNRFKRKKYRDNFELVRKKLRDVEERDHIRNWQPPVSGEDIMQAFNIKPGRHVGIIKNAIKDAILDGIIQNDRQEAFSYMLEKGKALGLSTPDEQIRSSDC